MLLAAITNSKTYGAVSVNPEGCVLFFNLG